MNLTARSRSFMGLGGDPGDISAVLVNVLIAGFVVLAITGTVGAVFVADPGALVQPIASVGFVAWGVVMRVRNRPRPIPMLMVSMTLAVGYLVLGAVGPTMADVTDTSPIVIVVGAGAIALAAGSTRATRIVVYALTMTAVATALGQWGLGETVPEIGVDTVTAVIVMGITFGMVRAIRGAVDDGSARYRGLIESAPVAVVDVDLAAWTAGADTVGMGPMNPAAAAMLGFSESTSDVVLERSEIPYAFGRLLDDVSRSRRGARIVPFRRSGRVMKVGWQVDRSRGRVVFSGTDITAQRRAEDELSGKVSARDRFIASVSHELRTPLAGALGLLEIVASGDVEEAERTEMIGLALDQVRDMVDIVEDLLVAARAAGGQLTINPVELDLEDAVQQVLSVTAEPIRIECDGSAWVFADPVRVRQILKNLVSNAVRYGGAERRVVVRSEEGRNVVEVRDSGSALGLDFASEMFRPYERASAENADSVGLGLAVARTLADQMGGSLVYLYDGEVVFRLELPAHQPSGVVPS